jgi:predicted DNA binding CopG/RHH family protein
MEKTINFKVDEDFYKQIKVKIALEGITLKDYVISLIKSDLEKSPK